VPFLRAGPSHGGPSCDAPAESLLLPAAELWKACSSLLGPPLDGAEGSAWLTLSAVLHAGNQHHLALEPLERAALTGLADCYAADCVGPLEQLPLRALAFLGAATTRAVTAATNAGPESAAAASPVLVAATAALRRAASLTMSQGSALQEWRLLRVSTDGLDGGCE
ncbi:unnamed protein product, partial [Polarella glacialis]